MKVVIIGDVHGRDTWKKQVQEPADLYIFIGDYWDSFDIPFEIQKENFIEILEFYKENPDKVVLLSGNHCLSSDTEILTESGFKNINEYIENPNKISTYNIENGAIEYQYPIDIIYKNYQGDMYEFESTNISMLMTPEHRILGNFGKQINETYLFKKPKDIDINSNVTLEIPVAGKNIKVDYDISDDEIKLVSWILSDGWFKKGKYGTSYGVSQSKESNIVEIEKLLDSLKVKYKKYTRNRETKQICGKVLKSCKPSCEFRIPQKNFLENLIKNERYDFPEWLRELSERQFNIFLEVYIKADGCAKDNNAAIHGNYKALSFIQELCTLNNIRSFIKTTVRGHYVLNVAFKYNTAKCVLNKTGRIVEYDGKVFCFTLPNGTFVARRNGKVFITGNCLSYIDFNYDCSGFQNKHAFEIRDLMKPLYENGELQACKILNGHIFSHAGVTKEWCERYGINLLSTKNLEKEINELFQKNLKAFCFQDAPFGVTNRSYYGDDTWQSLLWVRPYSLMLNQIDGFKQVVGHTQQKGIVYNEMHGIYFVDCQESSDEFLILEL